MSEINDFFMLNELFLNLGAVNSPSEVQGMLCGKLVCGVKADTAQWVTDMVKFMDLEHVDLSDEQKLPLEALLESTQQLLSSDEFIFSPLLPDDNASLERRVQELGWWCQGFLHGVGTSGIQGDTSFSTETADAIKDLAQISQVELEHEDDAEEGESALVELEEYVKVAVLTVYGELAVKPNNAEPDNQIVH